MKAIGLVVMLAGLAAAQIPNPTQQQAQVPDSGIPIYRITVVARTTKAINYHHRSGATEIGFRGTALMPQAKGEAQVESKQGAIKIDASMEKMDPPSRFGPEYLTYVLWAITPEGRAQNLGEVLLSGSHSSLHVTSDLQAFGLIVTAEPYFAVTQPSDVVVMENFVRNDTTGNIEQIDAKYELLQRGQYTLNVNPSQVTPLLADSKTPLELLEARNAVRIAKWTGAQRYAADTFQKALIDLQNAEGFLIGKGGKRPIGTEAREAVQMSEDARIITIRKIRDEQLAAERQASADREAAAKAQAERETQEREQADAAKAAAQQQAIQAQADADQAKRAAEQSRQQALADQQQAADALRVKQQAEADAAQAKQQMDEANRLRQQAVAEKEQLREQLRQQLNTVLETRDTVRGLIVNMSGVLFDTDKATLKPGAREKLAKISGIVVAHPGLKLEADGYTDSTGGDEYNQKLSEERADSVRAYLVQQGVPVEMISSRGFGKGDPVATNDTAAGRQQNRRVEIVVSGDIISTQLRQQSGQQPR